MSKSQAQSKTNQHSSTLNVLSHYTVLMRRFKQLDTAKNKCYSLVFEITFKCAAMDALHWLNQMTSWHMFRKPSWASSRDTSERQVEETQGSPLSNRNTRNPAILRSYQRRRTEVSCPIKTSVVGRITVLLKVEHQQLKTLCWWCINLSNDI